MLSLLLGEMIVRTVIGVLLLAPSVVVYEVTTRPQHLRSVAVMKLDH